jgi:Methyltransferase domain
LPAVAPSSRGSPPRNLVQSTAVDPPFDDESFDLVFSHGVIH